MRLKDILPKKTKRALANLKLDLDAKRIIKARREARNKNYTP